MWIYIFAVFGVAMLNYARPQRWLRNFSPVQNWNCPSKCLLGINLCDIQFISCEEVKWHIAPLERSEDFPQFCSFSEIVKCEVIWCDLGKSAWSRTWVLIWRGTFCWKPYLNRIIGPVFPKLWAKWKDSQNSRNQKKFLFFFFFFFAISLNQCSQLPTNSARL